MIFYCKDCSYRGKKSGQGGQCPACGSFNVSASGQQKDDAPPSTPKWRMVLLLSLWGTLLIMIIWKLVN